LEIRKGFSRGFSSTEIGWRIFLSACMCVVYEKKGLTPAYEGRNKKT